jgi:hypothetical protein
MVSPALSDAFRPLAAEQKRSLKSALVWALEQYATAEMGKGRPDADAKDV